MYKELCYSISSSLFAIFKDVVAGSNTQHVFFTMNPSPLFFVVDEFLLGFCFLLFILFCLVFFS